MSRVQTKNSRLGTYEINKFFLSYFDDNLYSW